MSASAGSRVTASEAVPLVHVLAAIVATRRDVRLLAIKGPALAWQGLRAERVSADVDVLVHPADVEALVAGLEEVDWHEALLSTAPPIMPTHSVNMLSDAWPVGIDVHHYFPGFLAEPAEVFEALWERRHSVALATRDVDCLDPVGHVALVALHHLREQRSDANSLALGDLRERALAVLDADDVADLLALATRTDSMATLWPFLSSLGVVAGSAPPARHPDALALWNRQARAAGSTAWLFHLARQPLRRWPAAIRHAVMLSDEEIRTFHAGPSDESLSRLRLRRVKRSLRSVPRAALALVTDRWKRLRRG